MHDMLAGCQQSARGATAYWSMHKQGLRWTLMLSGSCWHASFQGCWQETLLSSFESPGQQQSDRCGDCTRVVHVLQARPRWTTGPWCVWWCVRGAGGP